MSHLIPYKIGASSFFLKKQIAKKQICVTGLGRVGLPLACSLAAAGHSVLGVDIDPAVISRVQSAKILDEEPDLQGLLLDVLHHGRLKVSKTVSPAEIHIIAVPTLLGPNNQPDISAVAQAIDAIKPHLRPHDLILIESTCPIGTTETIAQQLHMLCSDLHVAYCPERILPGNALHELVYNARLIGGVDAISAALAAELYQSFVCGEIVTTNVQIAEAVKLAENAYRDINIAYSNELSMIADRLNLDINELIRLANKHPRTHILNPGPGVGGHCIAVDPWFLVSSAPDLAIFTAQARAVNQQKTAWVIQKVKESIKENHAESVACLGLTYKPEVADISASPALVVADALAAEVEVLRVDPYLPNTEPLDTAVVRADIIVLLVAHSAFQDLSRQLPHNKIILDFTGLLS